MEKRKKKENKNRKEGRERSDRSFGCRCCCFFLLVVVVVCFSNGVARVSGREKKKTEESRDGEKAAQ